MPQSEKAYWQVKNLDEMSESEWENLCDRCGRCCLVQLEDEDSGDLLCTNIACKQFNLDNGNCQSYKRRADAVPTCMVLSKETLAASMRFAPSTCAYRLLYEGKPLFNWHHLISGSFKTVHESGVSVLGKVVLENTVAEDDFEDHIVDANTLD